MNKNTDDSDIFPASVAEQTATLLHDLLHRARALLHGLKVFQSFLYANGSANQVELSYFRKSIESEAKSLETISKHQVPEGDNQIDSDNEPKQSNTLHALKSSNLPFYEAVWLTARSCTGVLALSRRVSLTSEKPSPKRRGRGRNKSEKYGVIDVVASDGLEWIKISTINEKRLLFDIAKEGWAVYGDESDVEDDDSAGDKDASFYSAELEIVKLAWNLCTAARNHRVRHKHPKVRFIFPKIREGCSTQIDAVMSSIRAAGAVVECALASSPYDLANLFNNLKITSETDLTPMLPRSSTTLLTPTINIDCTVLLALISDISHVPCDAIPPVPNNQSGTYHAAILKQIEVEQKCPFLPLELYPVLQGRKLVCTNQAADRMRQIVRTMGTTEERLRGQIFFACDEFSQASRSALLSVLQSVSCHPVPQDLDLPIQVVQFDDLPSSPNTTSTTPAAPSTSPHIKISTKDMRIARRITSSSSSSTTSKDPLTLSPINKSVFLYGWSTNTVTITSNKVVAIQLGKRIDEILDEDERLESHQRGKDIPVQKETEMGGNSNGDGDGDEFTGPIIYVCETARSLVGKEKQQGA